MERRALESAAANYPYLQGLYGVPLGVFMILGGLGNLGWAPLRQAWVFGLCAVVIGLACLPIARYYKDNYGSVTLTRDRQVRSAAAGAIAIVILVGANIQGGPARVLPWSPDQPISVFAASFAVGTLIYYAMTVGLRAHHIVIWGSLLMASLLPIWGDVEEHGAFAMFPIAAAIIASGLLDHRLLVRTLGSPESLSLENGNAGG